MKLPRKFLRFDYGVHILFGVLAVLAVILTPFTEGTSVWFLFPLWFLVGVWQLLSALVLALAYQDKMRAYYLLAVMAYGLVFSFVFHVFENGYMLLLSLPFAAWYAYLTYKDATYRTPSFWDLEF